MGHRGAHLPVLSLTVLRAPTVALACSQHSNQKGFCQYSLMHCFKFKICAASNFPLTVKESFSTVIREDNAMTSISLHLDHWQIWLTGTLNILSKLVVIFEQDVVLAYVYWMCMEEVLNACPPETPATEITVTRYSIRAMSLRLGLPKSTIHDKLQRLNELGFIELDGKFLSIAKGKNGEPKLLEMYPDYRNDIEAMLEGIKNKSSVVVMR